MTRAAGSAVPDLEVTIAEVFVRAPDGGEPPSSGPFARARASSPVRVGALGLENSHEFHRSDRWAKRGVPDASERAVLVQTAAHLAQLRAAAASGERGLALDARARARLDASLRPGAFGENLFVDGGGAFDGGALCVGDEWRAYRGGAATGLVLQVASARLPCGKVDQKHAQAAGRGGVRAHCAATGRAGAFLRVLAAGDVAPGDRLRLAARPRARWTLRRCSELLYGGGNDGEYLARAYAADRDHRTPAVRRAEWGGSEAELRELAFGVPELATCEWREHLVRMLAPESFPNFRGLGRYRAALALRALGARYAAPVACLCLALALALVAAALGGARARYS